MLRAIDTTLELDEAGDYPRVIGRIVPFGVVAHIRELDPAGELEEYDEEFLPGCTERMRQVAAKRGGPGWIWFTYDHQRRSLESRLGYCTELAEADDGVYATLRLDNDARLEKVRSMLSTSHRGLSIEFDDHPPHRPVTGPLRRRRSVNITTITATPIPVYESAGILAMRSDGDALAGGTPRLDAARAMLAELRGEPATT